MNVEFSQEDLELIDFALSKEESEVYEEIRHCRNPNYKEDLKEQYKRTRELLTRIRNPMQAILQV